MMKNKLTSFFVACVMLSAATGAHAQPKAVSDADRAETLFREALALEDAHKFKEACKKFEESQNLDPATGTLMNLARCHERNEQYVLAYEEYRKVAEDARRDAQGERASLAKERANELESKIGKLEFNPGAAPRLSTVSVDNKLWHREALERPITVDKGAHRVIFIYDNNTQKDTSVTVEAGMIAKVVIPTPHEPDAPKTVVVALPPPSPKDGSDGVSTAGWIVGGVGVAGVAAGAVFGLMAIGKKSDVDKGCDANRMCSTPESLGAVESAKSSATLSTIGFIAGGTLIAAGAALVLWPRDDKPQPGRRGNARLQLSPAGTGMVLGGTFE